MEFGEVKDSNELINLVKRRNANYPNPVISKQNYISNLHINLNSFLNYSPELSNFSLAKKILEMKEETVEHLQTQNEETTQIETGILSSPEENKEKAGTESPINTCKQQTFREHKHVFEQILPIKDDALFSSMRKMNSKETIEEFVKEMIVKMSEAAVKKSTISNSPENELSPVDKLLDDSCPELHLYKYSTFTKEKITIEKSANQPVSLLTKALQKSNHSHKYSNEISLLPTAAENEPEKQKLRIFLFGTTEYVDLFIAKKHTVEEIINHVICLSNSNVTVRKLFLEGLLEPIQPHYKNPTLYEIKLLEDEEDPEEYYIPLYDAGALDNKKPIGEFSVSAVAFCRIKHFQHVLKDLNKSIFYILK